MESVSKTILYHGTDARIVSMNAEERKDYTRDCHLIIDYLYPFFEMNPLKMGHLIGDEHLDKNPLFWKAFICVGGYKNKNAQYQYGSFYLTNRKDRAVAYAYNSFAGGELGLMAYELYQGALKACFQKWNPTHEIESAAKRIFDFAESPSSPILFSFTDYDSECLRMEDGQKLDREDLDDLNIAGVSLRYEKEIVLDVKSATILKHLSDFDELKRIK